MNTHNEFRRGIYFLVIIAIAPAAFVFLVRGCEVKASVQNTGADPEQIPWSDNTIRASDFNWRVTGTDDLAAPRPKTLHLAQCPPVV